MSFFQRLLSLFKSEKKEEKKPAQPEVMHGVVRQFNHSRGFGFIYSKTHQRKIFLHISDFDGRPKIGQKVVFKVEENEKGLRATEVRLASK